VTTRSAAGAVPRQLLLTVVTAASLAPLAFMLITSLKSSQEYSTNLTGLPRAPTLENYRRALTELPTLHWTLNSLAVTVVAVTASTAIGALAAYAISFGTCRGRGILVRSSIGALRR